MPGSPGAAAPPRPDLYVVLRLLEALLRNSNQLSRAALQRDAGLNYTIFVRYLELLEGRGIVATTTASGSEVVVLTARGYEAYRFLISGLTQILGADPGRAPGVRGSK
jgi:predicted transcriptional regulator